MLFKYFPHSFISQNQTGDETSISLAPSAAFASSSFAIASLAVAPVPAVTNSRAMSFSSAGRFTFSSSRALFQRICKKLALCVA